MPATIDPPRTVRFPTLKRTKGYRPMEVTLTFPDGSQARPDSMGSPVPGSVVAVGPELLVKAESTQTVRRDAARTQDSRQVAQGLSTLPVQVYSTAERPILQASRGASVRVYWHNPLESVPGSGDVLINPSKVFIDSQLGLIEIGEAAPQDKTSVVAYYYTQITEKSTITPDDEWAALRNLTAGVSGFSSILGLSQVYPITRNKTDYLYGTQVQLRPPNMDRSSPEYYPVYEYRVEPDGSLLFAVPLHKFSDQPATITVKYLTLGIEPRIMVDLGRDADIAVSPEISPLKIAVDTITL